MKMHLFPLGAFILLLTFATFSQTPALNPQIQEKKTGTDADDSNSDLVITANVQARELKFEVVPDPKVEFPGTPERQTVWESDRTNLPEQVQPGVTYRNIGIRLRIYSRFAEIQRIVLEALDEPPAAPPDQAVTAASMPQAGAAVKLGTRAVKTNKRTPLKKSRR